MRSAVKIPSSDSFSAFTIKESRGLSCLALNLIGKVLLKIKVLRLFYDEFAIENFTASSIEELLLCSWCMTFLTILLDDITELRVVWTLSEEFLIIFKDSDRLGEGSEESSEFNLGKSLVTLFEFSLCLM